MTQSASIPGFPGYGVTEDGRVYSITSNWRGYGVRELAQNSNSYGYPSVRLQLGNVRKRIVVHRLVAAAFLPPRPTLEHQIRHLDGNKSNNCVWNLAWGTAQDNANDRETHGQTHRGFVALNRKLSDEDIVSARREYAAGVASIRALANRYGVTYSSMRSALNGLTYVEVH